MADVLSGLLQGIDRGFSNGLNLYKTVQDEARQKRLEQYQRERDATADQRYEEGLEYRDKRDSVLDRRYENDRAWERDKYELEQERLAAAAAATAAYRQQQLDIRAAEYKLKAVKENRAIQKERQVEWNGRVKAGVDAFSTAFKDNPDAAQDVYAADVYARIGVNQKVARAQGFELDAETASRLYAMPRPDGTYVIGQHTEKGFEPYDADPESDGEQALVMPNDVFARTFAGTEGSHALQGQQQAAAARNEVAAREAERYQQEEAALSAAAGRAKQRVAGASESLASIEAEIANLEGFLTNGEYRLSEGGTREVVVNTAPKNGFEAVKRARELAAQRDELRNELTAASAEVDTISERRSAALNDARSRVSSGITTINDATQGKTGQGKGFAATNAARTLAAGMGPNVAVKGLPPAEAQVESANMADAQMNRIKSQVALAKQQLPKGEISPVNEAKLTASIATAMEDIGGISKWQESARGQAASLHITGELYKRGLEFGYGFMAKVAMSNPKGAQIDAGLAALQNDVVKAFDNPVDRENVALLAAKKIGTGKGQTQDPEAALMMAIKEYNGPAPTLGDAGR